MPGRAKEGESKRRMGRKDEEMLKRDEEGNGK
jgi:hypothetical protein